MFQAIKNNLFLPILSLKARYAPLLIVYFAYGFSAFSGIAESFWVKDHLTLSTQALIAIGIWATVPWTIKMVWGQFVDGVKILGSNRKVYICIGAVFLSIGYLILTLMAHPAHLLAGLNEHTLYLLSAVALALGFVIQDVVADTMCVEVVDKDHVSEEQYQKELRIVQVLGRLSLCVGGLLAAMIGGIAATYFPAWQVFAASMIIPLFSVAGVMFIKLRPTLPQDLNWKILSLGVAYGIFSIVMGIINIPYNQEILFGVSFAVIVGLLSKICSDLPREDKLAILFSCIVIFIYRATPGSGPGVGWWQIDSLGFDPQFFGTMGQVSAVLGLIGLWCLTSWVVKQRTGAILLLLTTLDLVFSLPTIGMAYGLQDWTQAHLGFGARTIALVDVAAGAPFGALSMIPLLGLAAQYAPKKNTATWFALIASLMNLALNASSIMTKYINQIYVVERGHYENIGTIMSVSVGLGFIMSVVAIMIFLNPFKKREKELIM